MRELLEKISRKIKKDPEYTQAYRDMFDLCRKELPAEEPLKYLRELSVDCERLIKRATDPEIIGQTFKLHKQILLSLAPYDFASYIQYIEWERDPRKKFYMPRRRQLRPVVAALQALADDDLDLLAISLPPGTGKTTLAIFYLTWMAGKYPDEPMLTGSHSNSFVRGVYDECLRILSEDGEYLWKDVFPLLSVSSTNAKDCRIDIGDRQRFETLEFTSIGTGNAGLYRAARLLYCDDLVSGIEVALSKERLDKLWDTYTTDLRQRKIGDHCKELHIATRWSVHDVIGRLQQNYGDDPRAKFIVVPALNANDESNFNYQYGVGFTTEFYHEQRKIMDDVSWRALYMNEPIEREGLLYHTDEIQRYFELPESDPDSIIAVCDTKDRGADYCVMPIAYQYGNRYFIEDFICDDSNPDILLERLADMLIKHHVHTARFESNAAGGQIAKQVQERVTKRGGITKITTKFSTANKETRIITLAGFVKEHFLFKDENYCKEHREYGRAVNFLCSYTMAGKNKHDDVPDAIAMLVDFIDNVQTAKVEIFRRPW